MSETFGPREDPKPKKEIPKSGAAISNFTIDRNDSANKKRLQEKNAFVGKDGKIYSNKPNTDVKSNKENSKKVVTDSVDKPIITDDYNAIDREKVKLVNDSLMRDHISTSIKELQSTLWKFRDSKSSLRSGTLQGGKLVGQKGETEIAMGYKIVGDTQILYFEESDNTNTSYESYVFTSDKVLKVTSINGGKITQLDVTQDDILDVFNEKRFESRLNSLKEFNEKNTSFEPVKLSMINTAIDPFSLYTK